MRSNVAAYGRRASDHRISFTVAVALAAIRRAGRFFQALSTELGRIPQYQDRAEELREGLRLNHSNSRGRDQPDISHT